MPYRVFNEVHIVETVNKYKGILCMFFVAVRPINIV